MTRYAPLALAVLSLALVAPLAGEASAKSQSTKGDAPAKSSCSRASTKWSLNLPAGQSDASATIISGGDNRIWWIGAGAVPPNAQLIIEYKQASGIRGEVVLTSNAAELVQGASVDMHLRRASASGGRIAVAGSYHIQCK